MKKLRRYLIGEFFVAAIICSGCAGAAPKSTSTDLSILKAAAERYLMFDICWQEQDNNFSKIKAAKASLVFDEGKQLFDLWSNEIKARDDHKQGIILHGLVERDQAAIFASDSYEYALETERVPKEILVGEEYFGKDSLYYLELSVPQVCNLSFDADTNIKKTVINGIAEFFTKFFSAVNQESPNTYPSQVQLVISNFNLDYPSTFLYVPQKGLIYQVNLHSNPESYLYKTGPVDAGNFTSKYIGTFKENDDFVKKIIKNGIVRKIIVSH